MNIETAKSLSFDELRDEYRRYLQNIGLGQNSVKTAYSDTFYLWRNASKDSFWTIIEATDFEEAAREALVAVLVKKSSGNAASLVSGYLSHLRRFRKFVSDNDMVTTGRIVEMPSKADVPVPTKEQVDYYLQRWDELESYHLQEDALDKLFFALCPGNKDISDILLKVAVLNDFYSTNIYSVYFVAKHILSLDIDARLKAGDVTLVSDIQRVTINGAKKNFYSFATKYCSHHNPFDYPIYDSYVDKVLCFYRNRDSFAEFYAEDLKDYVRFKGALIDFRAYYGLKEYNLKEIDKYIWQLGKEYFPKKFRKKKA